MSLSTEDEELNTEINFEPDEYGIKITIVHGESSIIVEHSWDAAEETAALVQALPKILIIVQEALDQQEENSG